MTVCIAAICNGPANPTIVGASDRMITSGDVEFELVGRTPEQRPILKTVRISDNVVALTAGDAGFQADAIHHLFLRLVGNQHPTVRQVATLYSDFVNEMKQRVATDTILSHLGLNSDTFISRQREMNDDFVQRITSQLLGIQMNAETIFAGIDENRQAHIYTVTDRGWRCEDSIGFSAIGYGARHAESQFMLARHGRNTPSREAILLTYIAKRRSEIAPGVGRETDMFWISAHEGFHWLGQNNIAELAPIYDQLEREQQEAFANADSAWRNRLAEIDKRNQEQAEQGRKELGESPGKERSSEQPKLSAPAEPESDSEKPHPKAKK